MYLSSKVDLFEDAEFNVRAEGKNFTAVVHTILYLKWAEKARIYPLNE